MALAVQWSENIRWISEKKSLKGHEQTENLLFEEGASKDKEEE